MIAPQPEWMAEGLCAQTDPAEFFPEKGGATAAAKKVCFACDMRQDCLDYALANNEQYGIWGGTSARERLRINARKAVAR